MFGYEQFGWLGIVSPNIVPLITLSVTVVIVHRQMSKDNHKQIIYFVCFTAFLFLIIYHQILIQVSSQISSLPPFYYVRTGWRWDSFFTSRYFMPLAFGLISPLIIFADDLSWRSYGTSHVMINLLPFAHATSLYTIGKPFRDHPNWFWSNLPFGNDLVLLGGSLSFFAFTYLVVTAEPIRYRILTTTDN
jgi:hypothetical protein